MGHNRFVQLNVATGRSEFIDHIDKGLLLRGQLQRAIAGNAILVGFNRLADIVSGFGYTLFGIGDSVAGVCGFVEITVNLLS